MGNHLKDVILGCKRKLSKNYFPFILCHVWFYKFQFGASLYMLVAYHTSKSN